MSTRAKERFREKLNSFSSDGLASRYGRSGATGRSRSVTYAGKTISPDALKLKKFKNRLRKFFSDPGNDDNVLLDSTSVHSNEDVFCLFNSEDLSEDTSSNPRRGPRHASSSHAFGPSNPSDTSIHSFLQKRIPPIRRAKSVKTTGKENRPLEGMTSLVGQGANRPSDLDGTPSLFMPTIESPEALDLTGDEDAIVRPLHYSILGKEYCFEVITRNNGSRCFSCKSEGEREAWIEKIKRTLNPNLDNTTRVEHHLTLGVQEAKGLPTKKRYFCEICLDQQLYARTTSKWKNDNTVLWGESFEFTSIPAIKNITVHLYKDTDKKKKKDKDYMGLVNLTVDDLMNDRADLGKWFTLSTPSGNNKSKTGESMAIRIKARFLSVQVLPSEIYKPFAEFISGNYMQICDNFKQILTVSQKDELSKLLVRIMYDTGSVKDYMSELVMHEIGKVEEESLIFRENTIGTKSVEAFLRLVGMDYLNKTLGEFVKTLFDSEEDFEVDESRLPPQATLQQNQDNLKMCCQIALHQITKSMQYFPSEMQEVFSNWRVRCESSNRPRIATRLITASLFLRLLCPAILNPSLFGLAYEMPDTKTSRALTLVAKVIQNLANRSRFGNKEEYMRFMDVFIREQWDIMGRFIDNISDLSKPSNKRGFDGFIDLGKELAKLHSFFTDLMPTLQQNGEAFKNLPGFEKILLNISEQLKKPFDERTTTSQRLDNISEHDVPKSLSTHVISSTPITDRRGLSTSPGHSASMMEIHDFAHLADYNSPFHNSASQSSIPATGNFGSFNNSNNGLSPNCLTSTENLPSNSRLQHSQSNQVPLSFANPAYRLEKVSSGNKQSFHRGLSSPASLSLTALNDPQTDPTVPQHFHQSASKHEQSSKKYSSNKGSQPLSFHNPLQQFQQQHLETVFTTETVTYATPVTSNNYPPLPQRNKIIDKNKMSSDDESSNQSSCERVSSSSRVSTTDEDASSASGQRKTPYVTARNNPAAKDDQHVLLAATSSNVSISSAHLKTGLQKQSHLNESPRRRSSQPSKPSIIPPKKPSVGHNINNNNKPSKMPRSVPQKRYHPSFQLQSSNSGLVLELNNESELVDARPTAMPVSASRIKTTHTKQHIPARTNEKLPQQRRASYNKPTATTANTPLHLSTPEDQLTPEKRTAQWILANPTSGVDSTTHKTGNRLPDSPDKEVEQLQREVERLRGMLTDKDTVMSKLQQSEKREGRLKEKLRKAEVDTSNLLGRLNQTEAENNRLEATSSSQRKRISQLEIANARLLRAVNQLKDLPNTSSPHMNAQHPVARRQRSRQSIHTPPTINKQGLLHDGNAPAVINGDGRGDGISSDGSSSV